MRMILWAALLATAAIPLAGSAEPQNRAANWLREPSVNDYISAFPAAALRKGVDGQVTISCTVTVQGSLKDCKPVKERPQNLGFGAAAVSLSRQFMMRPAMKDGKAVESTVSIPMHFSGPGIPVGSNAPGIDLVGMQKVISRVPWAATPTFADVRSVYPEKARARQVGGRATMQCRFKDDHVLGSCAVINETPSGYGFGRAATQLASRFVAQDRQDGKSFKGATTLIPVTFLPTMVDGSSGAIASVDWVQMPAAQAFVQTFPAKAKEAGIGSSRVVLGCVVGPLGGLTNCNVRSEDPAGYGFGEAALQVSRGFFMRKWTDDGVAMVGRPINLPIRYDNQTKAPAAASKPPEAGVQIQQVGAGG